MLSVVVPNRISSGKSLANVEVLLQGLQIDSYNSDGSFQAIAFTNNPAWVILDILQRCGWSTSDLNLGTFASSASFCGELIATTDLNGNPLSVPRFECNLMLTKRQSAATVIRGIRVASSLMLRYGTTGLLELLPETTLAAQQASLPDGSNSIDSLDGGWPAYEFSDSSAPFSGIARNTDGSSSVKLSSRSISETSNRLSVEFQDESNEYQQDSLSLVDADDSALIGYEISSQSTALGIANFSQATRVFLRQLDKSTKGNLFIQFQTSFRALKVRPGDIIAVTYLKEGLSRIPFRVTKLTPAMNYQAVAILAQIHNDDWYSDNPAVLMNAGRQPGSILQVPRPLIGTVAHTDSAGQLEFFDFQVQEQIQAQIDGSATDTLTMYFSQPTVPSSNSTNVPLIGLSPIYQTTGGTLSGGENLYYAVTALDAAGNEGPLSFTAPVLMPTGTNTNQVTIVGLSFPQNAVQFNVYRGSTPQELYRITQTPQPVSVQHTDSGANPLSFGPPDPSFDHANFYYRRETAGPFPVDIVSATTVGWSSLGAVGINYSGKLVRIIEGTGRGQERLIASNSTTTLTINSTWSVLPDASSQFVVVDGSWTFAAVTATSPAKFEIPYQAGTTIQISGRSANVANMEAASDLCPITRVALGGGQTDVGIAAAPNFTLAAPGGGALVLSQVGFDDLTNAASITSGTLQLLSWNEVTGSSPYTLQAALDTSGTLIQTAQVSSFSIGDVIQIGTELMTIAAEGSSGNTYTVTRSSFSSSVALHSAGDAVLLLSKDTVIVPFAPGFFLNRAAENFIQSFSLPDMRICAAEFSMTNSFGNGLSNATYYLPQPDQGLRTLSGGQLSLQVSGFLTTQQNAAPQLVVDAAHAVRDIRATVTGASTGYSTNVDLQQNGAPYCSLQIASGSTSSSSVIDGFSLPSLAEGAILTLNVSLTPVPGFTGT
ncbi:MAG: phage tail protein, partial [Acidobacteriota bacterium]|nr:phage tail protein [Acidobacteriota bacterium]